MRQRANRSAVLGATIVLCLSAAVKAILCVINVGSPHLASKRTSSLTWDACFYIFRAWSYRIDVALCVQHRSVSEVSSMRRFTGSVIETTPIPWRFLHEETVEHALETGDRGGGMYSLPMRSARGTLTWLRSRWLWLDGEDAVLSPSLSR